MEKSITGVPQVSVNTRANYIYLNELDLINAKLCMWMAPVLWGKPV